MKHVIRVLGGNYEHWRVLHALARRQMQIGINAWATRGMGRLRLKRGATIFFYVFLSVMSLNTYNLVVSAPFAPLDLHPTTSSWITFQITSLFCLVMLINTFRELFVSNDDYNNLCFRPIDNKSYFLSKFSAMLVQILIITAIMMIPATISLLSTGQFFGWLTFAFSNFALQTTIVSVALSLFVSLTNYAFKRGKNSKVTIVAYLIMFGMSVPTFVWYFLPKLQTLEYPTHYPLWEVVVNPFAWYACLPALASGAVSLWTIFGTLLAVASSTLVYVYLRRYSNLELSIKVQRNYDDVTTSEEYERPERGLLSVLSILSGSRFQSAPMWLLFRAHLRANKMFRGAALGVLIVPILLIVMPIFIDLIVKDESVSGASLHGPLSTMYLLIFMGCLLMTNAFLLSSEFRASWVLFAAPVRLRDLCLFSDRLVRYGVCLPYVVVLFAVILGYGMVSSVWDAFCQVFLFALVLNGAVMLKGGIEANVPFSQGPEVMGKFFEQLVVIVVCSLLGGLCAFLIPMCTGTMQTFLTSVGALLLANGCAAWFYRWRIARRESQLEFMV